MTHLLIFWQRRRRCCSACLFLSLPIAFPTHMAQMSEEIENAALNVPRAILTTMILNGATGFAMVLAVLFCLGDVNSVLVSFSF